MAERTARIGKGKGPEVSPVLAATVISLLIGGLIGYTVRYFQVGYFSPAPLPDSMAASRSGQGGGGRPPGGGGGGGMARGGPLLGGGGVSVPGTVATEPVISALREQANDSQLPAETRQQLSTLADALQAAPNSSRPPGPPGQQQEQGNQRP